MAKRKTNFEQVPVAIAKMVAEQESLSPNNAGEKRSWQKIAAELVEERDPSKVLILARELNDALEAMQGPESSE